MKKQKISSSTLLFVLAFAVVVGLVAYVATRPSVPSSYNAFAQCLTENGAKMYGAWWCPHCSNQKKLFGTAFKEIEYIECSPGGSRTMSQQCAAEGIEGFPTWVFADDSRLSGERSFEDLAYKTGCELPAEAS